MWISDLDSKVRLVLVILLVFAEPLRGPILVVLVLVWFSDQLFNTLLRFDPYGRIVLTDEQRQSSNFFAVSLVVVIILAVFVVVK